MDTFSSVGSFDTPFVLHVEGVAYVRRSYALLQRYREESTEVEGLDWLSLCFFEPPFNKCFLARDAVEWWRELNFERRQRMHSNGRRCIGWHNLKMLAIPPRERDVLYHDIKDV